MEAVFGGSMHIVNQVYSLNPKYIKQLLDDLYVIGIAYELGSDYKAVARKLSIRHIGKRRKIYDFIINCKDFEKITDSLLNTAKSN